jgi:hypothetical protein
LRHSTVPLPISARTRVASLSQFSLGTGERRSFHQDQWQELEEFGPNIIIGSFSQLKEIVGLSDAGTLDLESLDIGLLVTTEFGAETLRDIDRVILWQAFGIPVYETIVSLDRRLIACECEAHEGWHLESGISLVNSQGTLTLHERKRKPLCMLAGMETGNCPCGRKEPRIIATADQRPATGILAAIA